MKRIYRWILIAAVFQFIVFSYVEFIYLPNRGNIRATAYEAGGASIKTRSINLSSGMEDIKVSYNGSFMACMQNKKLIIINIINGKKVKTLDAGSGEFTYFRWLPDRDMLIYSVKAPEGKQGQVRISTFDVGAKLERSYPKITGLAVGSEIVDIELSPLTNVVYSMIKTSESRIKIYKFNIMDELSFIMNTGINTILKEAMYEDSLVYQTKEGEITIRSGRNGKKSHVPIKGGLLLLSLDANDNIYAGGLDKSGKVISVSYGKSDGESDSWKKIELDSPERAEDLFITPDGSLYRKAVNENTIYDLKDGSSIVYTGEFLEMLDNYVVTRDGKKLKLTVIKK